MANTKEFFKTKKAWSIYKDELLCSYILPYFNKVMSTGIPIVYIDGFAGKGKFDDGTLGSPLLVKEKLYQAKAPQGSPPQLTHTLWSMSMLMN